MPRANGGREYPSPRGSNVAARENQNTQDLRIDEPPPLPKESPPLGLAVAAAAAPAPAGAVVDAGLPQEATRAGLAPNGGQRRDHHPAYSVPFDGWIRELDGLLEQFCKLGRDGEREAILAIR